MTMSLVSWCFASLLMPFAAVVPGKLVFYFIFLERFLLGLFQSGIVTSTAAMSSKYASFVRLYLPRLSILLQA